MRSLDKLNKTSKTQSKEENMASPTILKILSYSDTAISIFATQAHPL